MACLSGPLVHLDDHVNTGSMTLDRHHPPTAIVSLDMERKMVKAARVRARALLQRDVPMARIELADNIAASAAGVSLFHHLDGGKHIVKATVALPGTTMNDMITMLTLRTAQHYHRMMQSLLGDLVVGAITLHTAAATDESDESDSISLHWLTLQPPHQRDVAPPPRPQDYVYLQHTSMIVGQLVSLWHSITLPSMPPRTHVDRGTFHQSGFVVTPHANGHITASFFLSVVPTLLSPSTPLTALPASSSSSSSATSSAAKPTTPRHTLSLASIPSVLYPHIQKHANRLHVTPELEADMRDMGQAAVDALLGAMQTPMLALTPPSSPDSHVVHDVELYEDNTSHLYTVKAVVTLPPYNMLDVMALLDMRTTSGFRQTMRTLLDGAFVDGAVLHAAPPSSPQSAESMTLNWLAVQNSKVHLPHRDYVFLKYGNCYRRCSRNRRPAVIPPESTAEAPPPNDMVAVSVWESVDLAACGPLPNDLNILRLNFRRCGYVIESVAPRSGGDFDGIRVSFFMSEEVLSSRSVSPLGKAWVVRMAQSVERLRHALMEQYVAEGRRTDDTVPRTVPSVAGSSSRCYCCTKRFSLLRRRHPCQLCCQIVCKRCLDKQFQLDLCVACCVPTSVSLIKYWTP
ncbi:hypothetical protein DYB30_005454 [Aphanomyces astaci]|uniref:FYVE-type domain-containing protein n=2 Tax=Aphanomyces astaci TaxID=112090 RepID=A0A397DBW0_APHAT|nr:hypothetical protein DYB30_005454 [Aphanomyces astaci]